MDVGSGAMFRCLARLSPPWLQSKSAISIRVRRVLGSPASLLTNLMADFDCTVSVAAHRHAHLPCSTFRAPPCSATAAPRLEAAPPLVRSVGEGGGESWCPPTLKRCVSLRPETELLISAQPVRQVCVQGILCSVEAAIRASSTAVVRTVSHVA